MDTKHSKTGLSIKEAEQLHVQYGPNSIAEKKQEPLIKKVFEQLKSFLIILLLIAAVLSFVIGEWIDSLLIITIVLLNAAFGVYQEYQAEQAVAALKEMSQSLVRVIRDGVEQEIDSIYLVPGDIFLLEEGVKVPADAKIVESHNLELNEAALTGESLPIVKSVDDEIFMGTIVAKGRARAVVSRIGMETRFGGIAAELSSVREKMTPLQKKLTHLTEIIGLIGIMLSFIVFALSFLQGAGTFPSFLLAISLAVAVVPESLPAVMTIILSIGVKHMAQRKAIVRKLGAIEALGSTTLIATDKTGTLTQNKMNVKDWYVDGTTCEDKKDLCFDSEAFEHILRDGIVCSTASLVKVHDHGNVDVLGDPTEGALLIAAHDKKWDIEIIRRDWKLKDELSFNSVTKRMSVLVERESDIVYSKGAPESILQVSSHILVDGKKQTLTEAHKLDIRRMLTAWSEKGLRVLAFGYAEDSEVFSTLQKIEQSEHPSDQRIEKNGLIFLGMAAIHDPPRKEATDAIKRARRAGIEVIMITGDNERTAEAIGVQVGLVKTGDTILTGSQIDTFSDEELLKLLPTTRVFARTTPFHKSRIVSLYQKLGEVVTVTGDGVNDAIALKQADVGVAMGKVGTDVARETSDMVILDDNFATIVNAVEEGRNIVKRLTKAIQYLLTGNISEGLTLVIGLSLGLPPLLLPIQLLYINLISDGIPALAMAFSPHDDRVMREKPQSTRSLLNKSEYSYILVIGLAATVVVMLSHLFLGKSDIERTTVTFVILAIIQTFVFIEVWFNHISKHASRSSKISKIFLVTVLIPILLQYFISTQPWLADLFRINTITPLTFVFYIGIAATILIWSRIYRTLRQE